MSAFLLHAVPAALPGLVMLAISALLHRTTALRHKPRSEELSDDNKLLLEILTRPRRITDADP